MISPDIAKETRFSYPRFLIDNGVQAVANVPIMGAAGEQPLGILQIDSREPRQFTDNDTAFLRTYANLLAAAVNRLRMTKGLRDREARLRRSEERFRRVAEIETVGVIFSTSQAGSRPPARSGCASWWRGSRSSCSAP